MSLCKAFRSFSAMPINSSFFLSLRVGFSVDKHRAGMLAFNLVKKKGREKNSDKYWQLIREVEREKLKKLRINPRRDSILGFVSVPWFWTCDRRPTP